MAGGSPKRESRRKVGTVRASSRRSRYLRQAEQYPALGITLAATKVRLSVASSGPAGDGWLTVDIEATASLSGSQ